MLCRVALSLLTPCAGDAVWDPPRKTPPPTRAMIYWRRPEEWAERLAAWVARTGQSRSIVTFFEILEGDEAGEWQPPQPRPCT